ncbi:hypothetical protein [Couchioplanes caeruleus]|uniref:hypothetical protein n=1 Tax=Couchioplanes caeruleus TaxID=56438 RepID=UPI001B80C52C|nr:hypothetical protein [Couchioplanes caeruleus]
MVDAEARLYSDPSLPALTQTYEELAAELGSDLALKATTGHRIVGAVRARLEGSVLLEVSQPRVARVSDAQRRPEPRPRSRFKKVQAGFEVRLVLRSEAQGLVEQLNLRPEVGDAFSGPENLVGREADSGIALVRPPRRGDVHEDDIVFPGVRAAGPQP